MSLYVKVIDVVYHKQHRILVYFPPGMSQAPNLSSLKNGKFRRKERKEAKRRKGFLGFFLSILCTFAPLRQCFSIY